MSPDDFAKWCRQQPRPVRLRVTSVDGAIHEVQCGQSTWPKVGETLAALQPEQVQALGPDGVVLRAVRPADVSSSEDWHDGETADPRISPMPPIRDVPLLSADPETQRFHLFAQLISQAYAHSTQIAFGHLVAIVEAQGARSDAVERSRDAVHKAQIKALEEQIRNLGAEPEQGGDLLTTMVSQFVAGLGARSQPPPAPVPTGKNGKAQA